MIRHLIAAFIAALALNAFAAVDANQASRADLETVKGIGPGLSAKIVQARKAGSFKGWGDLVERVSGIGAGNAARLSQAGLTVEGAAYNTTVTAPVKTAKKDGAAKAKKTRKADAANT